MDGLNVMIALPAYNESAHIASVIAGAKMFSCDILVIDDGSSDGTAQIAQLAGATILTNKRNMGYGFTIQRILSEARTKRVDILVVLDADNQHSPADVPKLLHAIKNGYDLAIGCRDGVDVPFYRRVGGTILSIFTRLLSGYWVRDSQCGFRAYSLRAVDSIKPRENGMAVSSEIVVLAVQARLRIIEVPISIRYTDDSSTHNPVYQGFYTLAKVLVMIGKKAFTR